MRVLKTVLGWTVLIIVLCVVAAVVAWCIVELTMYITHMVYGTPLMLGVLVKQPQKYWDKKHIEEEFSTTRKQLQDISVHAGACTDMPVDDGEGAAAEAMARGNEHRVRSCASATMGCIYKQCEDCASYKY